MLRIGRVFTLSESKSETTIPVSPRQSRGSMSHTLFDDCDSDSSPGNSTPHSLFDDCDSDSPENSRTSSVGSNTNCFNTIHGSADSKLSDPVFEHIVQFYDTQEYLLNVLTNFVVPILGTKDAAVVLATKEHLEGLGGRLRDRGVFVEKAKMSGQLSMIDAHEMLDKLRDYDDECPLSIEPIDLLLRQLDTKFVNIYVYGELVNLLCAHGDHTSAAQLEEMWNGLMKRHKFTLLCGYDTNNFKEEHLQGTFKEVCYSHSRVGPSEECSTFQTPKEQDAMIAMLKQKAKALETEIERRKSVEGTLQRYLELLSTRAEESLRHQQESYHTLLSILPVGVYSAPITADCDGIFINERFCELSGMTEAKIRTEGWFSAVHVDDRDPVRHLWDISSHQSFGGKEEYRYVLPDGSIRWVTGETVQFTSHKGKSQTYVHTIVDITELKKVEKQREKASRKAEDLLRNRVEQVERHRHEQEQFIDTLCHELRNPLSSIHGNVELLQIGLDLRQAALASDHLSVHDLESLRDQVRWDQESVSAIEKCVAHQKVITDDVLNLSKLEVGKVVLRKVDFNPKVTIIDATKMFEAEANHKGVTLRFNLPISDVIVQGDPDRVSQVLINLLANALKFTNDGSITLGMDLVERKGGRLLIKVMVKDDGIGLTKQEKAKLFHRFMQPTSTSYHEAGGSGLGLVISKGLVELMGGTISVESAKGQGSEFTFTFVAEESNPGRTCHTTTPIAPKSHKCQGIRRILVVEDNVINQRFLVRLLQVAGFVCTTAGNGREALVCVEQEVFDLILMDVHMPVLDGIASTKKIRAREVDKKLIPVPIVGLSGNAREEHKLEALSCGMNYYLTKPCRKDELYGVIDRFV